MRYRLNVQLNAITQQRSGARTGDTEGRRPESMVFRAVARFGGFRLFRRFDHEEPQGAAKTGAPAPVVLPDIEREEKSRSRTELDSPWLVICWNDPVNLMPYVTHVFQVVFGWDRQKAEFHMLQVHQQGKSLLARTTMEKAEHYVHQLQKYTLHATMEREE